MAEIMDNRLDIRFRFRPSPRTPDGILLHYLRKQAATQISHEMVLKALRAFWLPDAYQDCGAKKGQELRKLAINTIFALEEQANYLRTIFGIERQQPMYQAPILAPMQVHPPILEVVHQEQDEEEEDTVWKSVQKLDTGGL